MFEVRVVYDDIDFNETEVCMTWEDVLLSLSSYNSPPPREVFIHEVET